MIRNARMEHLDLTAAELLPSLASGNKKSLGLETASSANCLPCKHQELSSSVRIYVKKAKCMARSCNPSKGKVERSGQGLVGQPHLSIISQSQAGGGEGGDGGWGERASTGGL